MKQTFTLVFGCFLLLLGSPCHGEMRLREQLAHARVGDYIVASQNRTETLLLVTHKNDCVLQLQEECIPDGRFPSYIGSWREWLQQGAPGHTSWITYDISLRDASLLRSFSYTQNGWLEDTTTGNFLSTVLNLPLQPQETKHRRRLGRNSPDGVKDSQGFWQPRLVVDGATVPGATFNAWRTRWPNDGTEVAGKIIELYLPNDAGPFPAYFPYWLQVSGVVGKARMRVIDSGTGLRSPMPAPSEARA